MPRLVAWTMRAVAVLLAAAVAWQMLATGIGRLGGALVFAVFIGVAIIWAITEPPRDKQA